MLFTKSIFKPVVITSLLLISTIVYSQEIEEHIIPINRNETKSDTDSLATNSNSSEIFDNGSVDIKPKFPGGDKALMTFIAKNTKYPDFAKDNGIQGRVFTSFTINENGKVSDVVILRGVDQVLDKEAIRVISSLPDWEPGFNDGKAVKVRYHVPINFKLFDSSKQKKKPKRRKQKS